MNGVDQYNLDSSAGRLLTCSWALNRQITREEVHVNKATDEAMWLFFFWQSTRKSLPFGCPLKLILSWDLFT